MGQWLKVETGATFGRSYALDAVDTNTILISGKSYVDFQRGLLITRDGGKSFSHFENLTHIDESINDISAVDDKHFWFVTSKKIFATFDGGDTWEVQFEDTSITDFLNYIEMFDNFNGVAMGDPKTEASLTPILKTTDGGKNWIQVNTNVFGAWSGDIWRRIDFVDMDIGYFYTTGGIPDNRFVKTADGGKTWNTLEAPAGTKVLKFFNEKIGVNYAYSSSRNSIGIYATHDGGITWPYFTPITGGWGIDIEFIPNEPSKIWVSNMNTLFFSSDTGKTWTHKPTFYDPAGIRDIKFINDRIGWIISNNSLILKTNSGGFLVGIESTQELPNTFQLHQNYPNPFNPETTISYVIPSLGNLKDFSSSTSPRNDNIHVTLKVFDVLGREIATLVDEVKQPGMYNVKFTINNKHSVLSTQYSTLSSSVYFYRLQAGDFTFVKKMMFLK
jgi:photosystem II stability/assembly factor-like uncharacterized protein